MTQPTQPTTPGELPALDLLTADQILTAPWPEPVWAVPHLLPAGLTILAGRPKVGKSWLALQVARAVAAGGHVLAQRVEPGPVLYLALEDNPRRLQGRMARQGWPSGLPADFMPLGQFTQQIDDLRAGGGERLAAHVERVGYRLVVIDTLSRSCSGDQNDVEQMTRALAPLQEMAHATNCAVLMVDHHRKGFRLNPDAVGDILGSTAKGAMADNIWGLYRNKNKKGARLTVIGRDIAERTLVLAMDWPTGSWRVEGDADALELTQRRQEILDALEMLGPASLADIAGAIGQPRSNTHRRLQHLANAGLVLRHKEGRRVFYALP
jgi:DNA-binding transcriptional ArsR family regulator